MVGNGILKACWDQNLCQAVSQKNQKNQKSLYQVFFYERGVGQTFSSSTGAAAVFAVMQRLKKIQNSFHINTPFQNINITGTKKIYVENLTEIVYKGIYLH